MTDDLRAALDELEPGDRALLELSLQRGIGDDELARVLGTDTSEIGKRRRTALAQLAQKLGRDPADVEAELRGGERQNERAEARAGFLRSNSLSIFFLVIFLAALIGQSYAGWRVYNADQHEHEESGISYGRYLTSSEFANAVTENWQSEYLQFVLYIMGTIYLVQRGSPESKRLRERGRESDADQQLGPYARPDSPKWAKATGGVARMLYSNSLLIFMGLIWVGSWFAQSVTG